ncbi:MAG: TM2 domain-containing protein [Clostridia bacterium]|nr:TM2 domain-containing protein [Clostridia bacterium]
MTKKYQYKFMPSRKHRLVALFLCIVGGWLGLHYFYVRRYWRGAVNLFLLLALIISSSVFGLFYIQITFGSPQGVFVHWREAVAVISAIILGVSWILDIVHISKRAFKDNEKRVLK